MTLGNMRGLGAPSLAGTCELRHYEAAVASTHRKLKIEKPQVLDADRIQDSELMITEQGARPFQAGSCGKRIFRHSLWSLEQGLILMTANTADDLTILLTLRRFSKRFAEDKGGLSLNELARLTGIGSDRLARCLGVLASQRLITSAMTEVKTARRLFYLTSAGIKRSSANRTF
ncbi:MAG: hypothetical protein WAK69_12195 [Rhodoplanes sp.]